MDHEPDHPRRVVFHALHDTVHGLTEVRVAPAEDRADPDRAVGHLLQLQQRIPAWLVHDVCDADEIKDRRRGPVPDLADRARRRGQAGADLVTDARAWAATERRPQVRALVATTRAEGFSV
jgi:hypothetical protein